MKTEFKVQSKPKGFSVPSNWKETEIGMIPIDWNLVKLSDYISIIGGGTPKTSNIEYWDGDIPWLSVIDFNNDARFVWDTEKKNN